MLNDKDRILKNIYGWNSPDLKSAKLRGDWIDTKNLLKLGHEKIIEIIKIIKTSKKKNIKKEKKVKE